jgi:putative oxidoreductase
VKAFRDTGALVGRVLIALVFLSAGAGKLANPAGVGGYMAAMGMPEPIVPPLLYIAALIELTGGILLIAGIRTRAVALALFLFLIPVTIIFHAIPHDATNTLKNLAIMGGLLMVATQGPGRLSFDRVE